MTTGLNYTIMALAVITGASISLAFIGYHRNSKRVLALLLLASASFQAAVIIALISMI